jgi:phage shock protein PspC (stress-responsive transcriptional regulator)/predicted membrane protein
MDQNSSGRGPAGGFDPSRLKDVQSWRRSRSDRMVAGVCGGIGRALDIDPVLIRVVMAVLIIVGPGVLFYAAAWLLMPDEGSDRSLAQSLLGDRVRPDRPWLWPVVIGACVFLAIAMMSSFNFGKVLPGPVIVIGLLWLFVFRRKGRGMRGQGTPGRGPGPMNGASGNEHWSHRGAHWSGSWGNPPATDSTTAPATPPYAGAPATATGPSYPGPSSGVPEEGAASSATQRPQDRTVDPVQPVWTEDDPLGLYVDEAPQVRQAQPAPARAPGRRGVKPLVVLAAGAAVGIAALAGSPLPAMLAIGLATLGIGMLIGGLFGRTIALLPLGILLALGVLVTTVFDRVPPNFTDTNYVATPGTRIDAIKTYRFDAGSVQLDLRNATFAEGAKVVVNGTAGEILLTLPPNVDATGNLSAKAGDLEAFGQQRSGRNVGLAVSDLGVDAKPGPSKVVLDLGIKLGSIKVVRG